MVKFTINKLLTIGIPTYNSPITLIECLKSLEEQSRYAEDKIEIVISDNASDYDVMSVLSEEFAHSFLKKLKIHVNKNNLGYDANLEILAQSADGVYLKLLADDDLVTPSFISDLLNLIEIKAPDLVISNFRFLSNDMKEVKKKNWFDPFELKEDQDFLNLLNQTNDAHGQMSSLTFRTKLIRNLKKPIDKSNYIHVYWFLCLLETSTIAVERRSNILVREGSPNFSGDNFTEIVTPLGGILAIQSSSIENLNLKNVLLNAQKQYCLSRLTAVNSQNLFQRIKIFSAFYPYFKNSSEFWFYWVLIILMPNQLRVSLKSFRKRFLGERSI
jgi:glycosyltransferase involved in cell wall biosynthesis